MGQRIRAAVELATDVRSSRTPIRPGTRRSKAISCRCSTTPATLGQVLDTTAGKMYFVTFKLAGNPNTQSVKKVEVTAPGCSQVYEFNTVGQTRANMGWVRKGFTFIATDATSTLSFMATQASGNDGPAIDDVTVTQIASGGDDCKKDGWMTVIDSSGNPYNFKNQGDCVSFFATGEKNLADPRD
jgi:hypothetical protein